MKNKVVYKVFVEALFYSWLFCYVLIVLCFLVAVISKVFTPEVKNLEWSVLLILGAVLIAFLVLNLFVLKRKGIIELKRKNGNSKVEKPTNDFISYIEFKAKNLNEIKTFYTKAFGWQFTDFGNNYTAFKSSGIEGGFEKTNAPITNSALVVVYNNNLEATKTKVLKLGAKLTVDIFTFPGGSRFQFLDPSGNELAVWCHDS